LRDVLGETSLGKVEMTRYDDEEKNEIQIKLSKVETEATTEFQKTQSIVYDAFRGFLDKDIMMDKKDLNKVSKSELAFELKNSRVLETMGILKQDASMLETEEAYAAIAGKIVEYRTENGLIKNIDELSELSGVPKPLMDYIKTKYYPSAFVVIGIDSVGPKIGKQLREKAQTAILLALGGILIYLAFRFKFAYGIAALVALVHDILITLGLFSLMNKEISLTVVAGLLTLVGYSINDSIVVFDRIRENVKLLRNETFFNIINNHQQVHQSDTLPNNDYFGHDVPFSLLPVAVWRRNPGRSFSGVGHGHPCGNLFIHCHRQPVSILVVQISGIRQREKIFKNGLTIAR